MRRRRPATIEDAPDLGVVDIRERLAPYGHTDPRPGWRADLVAADAKRKARRVRTDAWGFRG
jgi:hypothetical protein